jgi:hypothetical protein
MRAAACAAAMLLAHLPEMSGAGVVSGAGWDAEAASGSKEVAADPADVHTVHIVSQCHLDGGYKYPYVAQVASEWFETWIPYSIALSEELRAAGGRVRHRWTMNPWLASLFLSCPEGAGAASWREHNSWTRGRADVESFRLRCPNATQVAHPRHVRLVLHVTSSSPHRLTSSQLHLIVIASSSRTTSSPSHHHLITVSPPHHHLTSAPHNAGRRVQGCRRARRHQLLCLRLLHDVRGPLAAACRPPTSLPLPPLLASDLGRLRCAAGQVRVR